MTEPIPPSLLLPLEDLGKWLGGIPASSVIVGGIAVSFLGRPRFTQDIDALTILPESVWERALATAPRYGIVPRIDDALALGGDHALAPGEIDDVGAHVEVSMAGQVEQNGFSLALPLAP